MLKMIDYSGFVRKW